MGRVGAMQGAAAPMPSENEARISARMVLRRCMRAAEEAEEHQLSHQIDQIVPNASALAMEAVSNPSVNRFNAREWFRRKLPEWIASDAVQSAVILALLSLYAIYSNWSFRDMTMGGLNYPRQPPPRLIPWMSIPTPMMAKPDACNGGSVVDEVFAKADAEAEAVARRRA